MSPAFHPRDDDYVDTPRGLFTASGTWYHTTEELLQKYAGPVLERKPLSVLLQQADVWLRSGQTITLWALPLLLLFTTPLAAAVCALVLYVGWKSLSPSFVFPSVIKGFKWFDAVLAQAFFYVFMMSFLAAREAYLAVWVGLGGFILIRWRVLDWATKPFVRFLQRTLHPLPAPDQILRALIVRYALNYDLSLPNLDRLKQSFRDSS